MVWSISREVFLMRAREVLNYESILQGARWCVTDVDGNSSKTSHVCTVNTSRRGEEFWDAQQNLWFVA
jgi:hypothetical protein